MVEWLKGGDGAPTESDIWGSIEKKAAHYSWENLDTWILTTLGKAEKEQKKKSHKKDRL
jgi:hypothetical protein